jgi:hypothetical protein
MSFALGSILAQNTLAESKFNAAASVTPGIFYTDNVCLSNTDKKESLDWSGVGLLTPSGSISSEGSRAKFSMNGSVQFNSLTDSKLKDEGCRGGFNSDREQFAPNINATGSGVLIEDWVNVSAFATANQNQVSPFVGGANDTLNRNGNTNTFYSYSVSPVISRRLKGTAKYNIRYTYNEVINTQDTVSDSNSSAWAANLANDKSSQVSWNLLGNYRKVQYSESNIVNVNTGQVGQPRQDTELKSAGLQLGYQIDRRWQVTAGTGWEWNDFQTFNDDNTGGSTWDFGARWTPTSRTSASLGMTDRFYGKAPRLNISHKRKRSQFNASYNKSITFSNDISTQQDLLNPNYVNNYAVNSNGPILDERFTLGYAYTGRRATLGLSGNHSDQTQEDNGQQSTFQGLALSVSPQLSRVYSVSGTMSWNESSSSTFNGNPNIVDFANGSESWISSVTVGRPLNSRARLSVNYQYTDQQSDSAFGGYQENRVMATVNISL